MSLEDLYSEIILDHFKNPRNAGIIEHAEIRSEGANESCGDEVTIFAHVNDDGKIEDIRFSGHGCAISQASASMMTERMKGKSLSEAEEFIEHLRKMLTGEEPFSETGEFDELAALRGVAKFPMRVKCATLAWTTLKMGIEGYRNNHSREP